MTTTAADYPAHVITWHTTEGTRTGADQSEILTQFGPSAVYRADAFLAPYACGRILVERGERTAAVLVRDGDGPPLTVTERYFALRRAGMIDRDNDDEYRALQEAGTIGPDPYR